MNTKKIAFIGLSVALAMILSYVESKIPVLVAIPGIKVGLPNVIIVFTLYKLGAKQAVCISLIRVFLASLLFGNVQTFAFSMVGAVVSLTGMIILKKINVFSCITVSIVGGLLHNIGQIVVACFWTQTVQIAYYLPVLLVTGTIAGLIVGLLSGILVKRLEKWDIG